VSNLAARLVVASIGIPLLLYAAIRGDWILIALVGGLQILMAGEWVALTGSSGRGGSIFILLLSAASVDLLIWLPSSDPLRGAAMLLLVICVIAEGVRSRAEMRRSIGALASFVGAIALPLALWLRLSDQGASAQFAPLGALAVLFVSTWFCDSGAYAVGRLLGKHPLWKAASPNKTIEGAIGGALLAALPVLLLRALELAAASAVDVVAVVICVGILGQFGDLLESLVKREAGVKDSSALLPGHGGFLDRFDSLFASTPAFFGYLILFS